jgi:glucan phosphoethanolaminetransferase (alkaline phosphatase superfamily)
MMSLWQELEDEGSRFLHSVGTHIPNYTASYPKRQKF